MSIERNRAPLVLSASEPPSSKSRNTADASTPPGAFAAVMQAQAAPKVQEKPKAPEAQRPVEARRAEPERTAKAEKTAKQTEEEKDEEKTSSSEQDGTTSAQAAAAAALALATGGLLGPVPAKLGALAKAAAGGKAVAGVDGLADGQQLAADALPADGTGRMPATGQAADAARAALADGQQPGAAKLASYASVLEQLQSRLAGGGNGERGEKSELPVGDKGLPATGIDTAAKAAAGVALQNARMDKLMNALQGGMGIGQAAGSETAKLASLSSDAGDALKAIDRFRGETPHGGAGSTPDGALGQQSFTATVQFDGTAVSAAASSPATSDAVADQVSYWVSQGIQNAELTLDGQGAERVEVKISMSGNEAHVEFRSDQAATREMLAGTASQLKELLSGQGVVLSGVTVGHAGADLAGGQQQQSRSREGRSPARVAAVDNQAVAAVQPSRTPTPAGALDLFV